MNDEKYIKTTEGSVEQTFNSSGQLTDQKFYAGDEVEYSQNMTEQMRNDFYAPFDMVDNKMDLTSVEVELLKDAVDNYITWICKNKDEFTKPVSTLKQLDELRNKLYEMSTTLTKLNSFERGVKYENSNV